MFYVQRSLALWIGILGLSGSIAAGAEVQDFLVAAKSAEAKGDRKTALAIYRKLSRVKGYREIGSIGMGKIFLAVGNPEQAQDIVEDILEDENPFHVDARLIRAEALQSKALYNDALLEVDRVLTMRPHFPPAMERKASILFDQGNFSGVDEFLTTNSIVVSGNENQRLLRARARLAIKRLDPAIKDFEQVIEREPGNMRAIEGLGKAFLARTHWKEAERIFRRLVQLSPAHLEGWSGLGEALEGQGRRREAMESYKKALDIDPSSTETSFKLASAYVAVKNFDHAQDEFKRALRIDPSHEPSAIALAELYVREQRYDLVGPFLDDYVTRFPSRTWAALTYAKLLVTLQLNKRAIKVIELLRENKVDTADIVVMEGVAYFQDGKGSKARETLTEGEKKFPETKVIAFNLAIVFEAEGELAEAEKRYRALLNDRDYGLKSRVNLALILERDQRFSEAASILRDTRAPASMGREIRKKLSELESKTTAQGGSP